MFTVARRLPFFVKLAVPITIALAAVTLAVIHFSALHCYECALTSLAARDLDTARSHTRFCLWIWPFDSGTYLLAARIERLDKKRKLAQEYLEKSRRCQGEATGEYQLETVLWHADFGNFQSVEKGLLNWLNGNKSHPLVPIVLESLACGYMRQKNLRAADPLLNKWAELEPKNGRARYWRGWMYSLLGDENDAETEYAEGVRLAPHDMSIRVFYTAWLLGNNNPKNAEEHIKVLLCKKGDDPIVQALYGRYLFHIQDFTKARKVLREALAGNNALWDASYCMAKIEFQTGEIDEAEKWARQTIETMYALTQGHYLLYQILAAQPGKEAHASERLRKYKEIKAHHALISQIVKSMRNTGHYDADNFAKIGKANLDLRLNDQAEHWLRLALQKDKDHQLAQELLASCHKRKSRNQNAAFQMHEPSAVSAKN